MLETTVDLLGVDAATATARHDGQCASVAATDARMLAVDEAQYQARSGPCVLVLDPHQPVAWSETDGGHSEWLAYHEAAAEAGVKASLSVHIPTEEHLDASLNLYAKQQRDFTPDQITAAEAAADQLGIILQSIDAYQAAARLAGGLAEAMRSRAVIEQAKGMLMAERQIDADAAFAMLVKLSQSSNTKLRDAATRLVEGRSAPDASP